MGKYSKKKQSKADKLFEHIDNPLERPKAGKLLRYFNYDRTRLHNYLQTIEPGTGVRVQQGQLMRFHHGIRKEN